MSKIKTIYDDVDEGVDPNEDNGDDNDVDNETETESESLNEEEENEEENEENEENEDGKEKDADLYDVEKDADEDGGSEDDDHEEESSESNSDNEDEIKEVTNKDDCIYNLVEYDNFDGGTNNKGTVYVDPKDRITKPYMTKYERARLLGDRTQQLLTGAKPMIKNTQDLNSQEIAALEIKNGVCPLIVVRPRPDGLKEIFYIREFLNR